MNSPSLPPGKDASLEDTIARASGLLDRVGLSVEPVSWVNPAPNCWSVHLQARECELLYTNGKGISQQAALASSLGEFIERLSTNFFFSDYSLVNEEKEEPFLFYPNEERFPAKSEDHLPPVSTRGEKLLNSDLLSFYDPAGELRSRHLYDINSSSSKRGIFCLPFKNSKSGEIIFFPVNILNNLYVSNGMSAGNSRYECYAQALSEIVERHVKNHVIANGVTLPDIPSSVIKQYPKIESILNRLRDHNLTVKVKDCSLGGKFPVICALLIHPESGGVYAAFGASYRFATAIERTLTEMLQGRQLNQLGSFNPPVHQLSLVADSFNLESHFIDSDGLLSWDMFRTLPDYSFTPWNFTGTTRQEYLLLKTLIKNCGHQIYIADYNHCGMPACRIIVPGMSEIYPVDDLIWNNKNSGTTIREQLLLLPGLSSSQLGNLLEGLEALNLNDQHLISDLTGIVFDPDSPWHFLSVGEFKALLFLALRRYQSAYIWSQWCCEHGSLQPPRKRLFRLLTALLGFILKGDKISDYKQGMKLCFREDEIDEAEKIVSAERTFPGLTFADSWQKLSSSHATLLNLYDRINRAKKQSVKESHRTMNNGEI
ncbi:MAG: YcaO-like family protein [Deltaproteobacteria bacterium]|nr:YcaO-like family protein [Deltaproteobacteria bacterium]